MFNPNPHPNSNCNPNPNHIKRVWWSFQKVAVVRCEVLSALLGMLSPAWERPRAVYLRVHRIQRGVLHPERGRDPRSLRGSKYHWYHEIGEQYFEGTEHLSFFLVTVDLPLNFRVYFGLLLDRSVRNSFLFFLFQNSTQTQFSAQPRTILGFFSLHVVNLIAVIWVLIQKLFPILSVEPHLAAPPGEVPEWSQPPAAS